jgi:hypothetical protein
MGSVTKCVPIKAHYSIGIVERYHATLCRAFEIITEELSANRNLVFNGGMISQDNKAIRLNQERQCAKIKLIQVNTDFKSAYIQERARGAYIASTCQPEAAFALSFAA